MILEILVSLLAVAGFGLALWWTGIASVARNAMRMVMTGLSSMMDSELTDNAKEVAVRRAGLGLIVASFNIFWRFCVALAAAAAPILLADAIDLTASDAVLALMLRLDYIIVVSVVAIGLVEYFRRRRTVAAETVAEQNRYSTADRFFHLVAFSSPVVLKTASWIEDRLLSAPAREPSAAPIFVTSLARGGTTALLNALHDVPGVATHTYRDMPFLTAPSLWNRLAGGRKRSVDRHQRAHGDGLEIDLDSPEAFEEVIWRLFWPEKFRANSIALWRVEDRKPDAESFFKRHMAKVIRARLGRGGDDAGPTSRYCSKNNANIARIPYLVEAFPDCRVIVPVRRPESHAASLLRQHRNFLKLQSEDSFVQRYMRDIGHFEFGRIHKPIQFPGFDAERYDPATGDYWLDYWIHAFREIRTHRDSCLFVLQDDLRSSPQQTMTGLCAAADLDQAAIEFSGYFRPGADHSPADLYDPRLYEEAADLYRELETDARSARARP